jgi:FkbM family methyltransferase
LRDFQSRPANAIRVQAVHAHWTGHLRLHPSEGSVVHEGVGHVGTYFLEDDALRIKWADFPLETFRLIGGLWVHSDIIERCPDFSELNCLKFGSDVFFAVTEVAVALPDDKAQVYLRVRGSDADVFKQVFVEREYDSPFLPENVATVVDLGANIGLSAIFFAAKYDEAAIYAVEPDRSNFDLLVRNVAGLGNRVQCLNAAIWTHDGTVALETEDDQQRPLDAWGVRVRSDPASSDKGVASMRMDTALKSWNLTAVDLLKVDIEGAELELFMDMDRSWLDLVRFVAVETHDRFRPGSEAAVRQALAADFLELPRAGENLLFRRRGEAV